MLLYTYWIEKWILIVTQQPQAPNSKDPTSTQDLPVQDTEPLWTVAEVAKYLRLNTETVRMMARRGELPSIKIGKRLWRFRPREVKDWLNLHS